MLAQFVPPWAGWTLTVRVRDWVPVPQLTEHAPYPCQLFMTQSIGHFWSLQLRSSER